MASRVKELLSALHNSDAPSLDGVSPLRSTLPWGKHATCGKDAVEKGKVACLLVAGGQGTRLGFAGPKGSYPITRFRAASLFQLFAEKTQAAANALNLIVMTSASNDKETRRFFKEQNYFGLENIHFISQSELPLLKENGTESGACGPDGNGVAMQHLVESGLHEKLKGNGVEHLTFVQIDNALSDPFDYSLIGTQIAERSDVTIKAIERISPEEKLGLLVQRAEQILVIEYSEFPDEAMACRKGGRLKYCHGNISAFCFHMDFVERVGKNPVCMPWHKAKKRIPGTDEMVWKFEKFIFDCLPEAKNPRVVLCPRELCYAPLKNQEGDHGPDWVRERLLAFDRIQWARLKGRYTDNPVFELHPAYYYSEEVIDPSKTPSGFVSR